MDPRVVLVMGVAGAGKTTLGTALARRLGACFIDADDLHSADNVARMERGIPLDDADRAPWLRDVRAAVDQELGRGHDVILACSALKATYRDVLLGGLERAVVVHLRVDRATLERRLASRPGHYMPASLLDSQLEALEEPGDAIVVDEPIDLDELENRLHSDRA
jgi:gluconokinase